MRRYILLLLVVTILSFFSFSNNSFADNNNSELVIVKYKEGQLKESKPKYKEKETNVKDAKVMSIPKENVNSVVKDLKRDSSIEYVEKATQYSYFKTVNDPLYMDYQKIDFDLIGASKAWDLYNPRKKVVVAVVDSGIDLHHEDLKNLIVKPYNVMNPQTLPYDDVGHGTHVAGIVGAETNNHLGIASLSMGVSIMPIKVGDKSSISNIDVADGIYYAVDNGADIINVSIGGPYSKVVEDACNYAFEKGVLVVSAAGNDGGDIKSYPAALKNVIAVAAVDGYYDKLASFSSFGKWVNIAAPGVGILSTYPSNEYEYMDGTSMASPMVASLAALVKGTDPNLDSNQIRWIMETSSEKYEGSEQNENGLINAYNALDLYNEYGRVYGPTSAETSNEIASVGWETVPSKTFNNNQGSYAIVASNQSFPDSLAAGALSYMLDSPIILTFPDLLKDSTVKKLNDLGVTNVLILGGKAAVSENVKKGLTINGFDVTRISGADRFETDVTINQNIAHTGGEVIVANGRNFPDSLSVSSFSAKKQIPIVFVEKDKIPKATQDFLNKYHFSKAIVVGGPNVISDNIKDDLPNAIRIAGKDRYETNIDVVKYFDDNIDYNGFIFATGLNYPDALAGGALSAKMNTPLLLVDKTKIPYRTEAFLKEKVMENADYFSMLCLGGNVAISPSTIWDIDKVLYKNYYLSMYSSQSQFQTTNQTVKPKVNRN